MGVSGLSRFIREQNNILIKNHRLHDCKIIVDAPNLMNRMADMADRGLDNLHGGNLVELGKVLRNFITIFRDVQIELVFVFDGAAEEGPKSKTPRQLARSREQFRKMRRMATERPSRKKRYHVLPTSATDLFKSVLLDEECQMVQCIYEADWEIARLAKELCCPVMSEDSDFFLIDLPQGLVLTDKIQLKLKQDKHGKFIPCELYKIERLVKVFPKLNKTCLPLLALLVGNDFVAAQKFEKFVVHLPKRSVADVYDVKSKNLEKLLGANFRIVKILHYLCGKTLEQNIQSICQTFELPRRRGIKMFLEENIKTYLIPPRDTFDSELIHLYREGFYLTHRDLSVSDAEVEKNYHQIMRKVILWLRNTMERQVVSQRLLQVLVRCQIPLRPSIDDSKLQSCKRSHLKLIEVLLSLVKTTTKDKRPCIVHDRVRNDYKPIKLYPRNRLKDLDLTQMTIFDLPFITKQTRRIILLNTFESNEKKFFSGLGKVYDWLNQATSEEYIALGLCLNFMDIVAQQRRPNMKTAVLMTFLYYLYKSGIDTYFMTKLGGHKFIKNMVSFIDKQKLYISKGPTRGKSVAIRVVHAINELQNTILSFNLLNGLLGNIVTRIRQENWLNSSLIYNLVMTVREHKLRIGKIHGIINV